MVYNFYKKYWQVLWLVALTACGFYLRARNLGFHSLYASDEGVIALAVRGILQTGRALLPINEVYPRSPLTLYLMALVSKIFGFNDVSLRSVGVFYSTLIIPLSYVFAKDIFKNSLTGLLTAAILAFSAWQIEMARQIKFYAPFGFYYLLSVYLFYKGFFQDKRPYKILFLISYAATLFTNLLAFSLIALFGLCTLRKKRPWVLSRAEWLYLSFTAVLFAWWARHSSLLMHRLPDKYTPKISVGLLGYSDIILPNFSFAAGLFKHPGWVFGLSWAALLVIFASTFMRKRIFLYAPVVALCAGGQIVLACLYLSAYLLLTSTEASFSKRDFAAPVAIIISFFVFWNLYGVFGLGLGFKDTLRAFSVFNYPHLVYPYMISTMFSRMAPFMWLGFLILFNRSTKDRAADVSLVWAMFFIPMLIMGSFLAGTHNEPRHMFNLHPFFVMIYVFAIAALSALAGRRLKIVFLTALLVLTVQHSGPGEAFAISQRRHPGKIYPMFALSSKQYIQMDFKGTALFMKDRLGGSDIVAYAGFPPNIFYYYIGRVDYVIRPAENITGEYFGYTPARHIGFTEFEKTVLSKKQRVWLITKKGGLALPDKYASRRVFTSSDNNFNVYLLEGF